MNFQPHLMRIVSLPIASILLIVGAAALRPVSADEPEDKTKAEIYVQKQVDNGDQADLRREFPGEDEIPLSGSFLRQLLIRSNADRTHPRLVWITGATITGKLDLSYQEIPYDVGLSDCTFTDGVSFYKSNFQRTLDLSNSIFKSDFDFKEATVALDLIAEECTFVSARFDGMRVGGAFSVVRSKFIIDEDAVKTLRQAGRSASVSFVGAHLGDVSLDECRFEKASTLDFTRMRADFISFDSISKPPSQVTVEGMTFNRISPVNWAELQLLLPLDAELYTALESSFRTHGYPDEADKIFIARKRAARREQCTSFPNKCHPGAWAWSMFQDMLAGYGKSLQNLLYWSLGFLLIGIFVFRREKGMRIKDEKDAPHYAGRYNAFWYSLDLFLPIIKLGEADVWTPKDDRRWANLYRRVHIIIGSLFVPIGLAAWTGIIK